jgi:hypothetical protein
MVARVVPGMTWDRSSRLDPVTYYVVPQPVACCEGCGRPLFIPHIDVPGIRCHWCSDNAIAWREPAKEWQ